MSFQLFALENLENYPTSQSYSLSLFLSKVLLDIRDIFLKDEYILEARSYKITNYDNFLNKYILCVYIYIYIDKKIIMNVFICEKAFANIS